MTPASAELVLELATTLSGLTPELAEQLYALGVHEGLSSQRQGQVYLTLSLADCDDLVRLLSRALATQWPAARVLTATCAHVPAA